MHFINKVIRLLTSMYMISHKKSSVYYPQANGQAESSNKILMKILRRTVSDNKKDWDQKLNSALWAFRTSYKVSTGMTPFILTYGLEAVVPMKYIVSSLRIAINEKLSEKESLSFRVDGLMQLEEDRLQSAYISTVI